MLWCFSILATRVSRDAALTKAIAESAIGTTIKQLVEKKVADLTRSWDNPLEKVVQEEVLRFLIVVVRDEFGEQIRAAVRQKVTEAFTEDVVAKMWDVWMDRFMGK